MATVSSGSKKERFGFIEVYGKELGVRYLCDWLNFSASGFYKWKNRREGRREKDNRRLSKKIERLYQRHKTNYGSPRIHAALKEEGIKVNHKRVARLMHIQGLVGKAGRIYRRKAVPESFYRKLTNLRISCPSPSAIDEQWVGDVTYLQVKGEWRYLAVVMDVYSRRIIGWSLGSERTAELTCQALRQAMSHRDVKPGLIFHTDRGSEYGAHLIQNLLKKSGIKSSMNRPSAMTDNAHMESFFQSMKTECIKGISFESESELRVALGWYLNTYYNKQRHHSAIGYTNPINYEKIAA